MRRRSNAIHSDSSQEYMLLAEYSHDRPGYFYDEKLRKEVDSKLSQHRQSLVQGKEKTTPPVQVQGPDVFSGFDYSPLEQERKEEEAEIGANSHRREVALALIVNGVRQAAALLHVWLGGELYPSMDSGEKGQQLLDLFTHAYGSTIFKIWIISCFSLDNALLQPYLTRTRQHIDLSEEVHDLPGELRRRVESTMQGYLQEK